MAIDELIFGLHAVTAALRHEPASLHVIWVEPKHCRPRLRILMKEAEECGIPVHTEARSELNRMTGGARHQGVVARRAAPPSARTEHDLHAILTTITEPALLLVLDGIQDPHNLGACLRSADAAGVHAVIAPADRAAGITATVRKVACGAAETVSFIQVTNLARTLRDLQAQGVWIIGAVGTAGNSLFEVDFTGPVAIVLGAEEKGLRRLTREVCDGLAHIPMSGSVESLNVAVAAGVFLFEALRQRRCAG